MKATKYLSEFLKADTIRLSGPQEFEITGVEETEFKDEKTGKLVRKLVLLFGDDQPKLTLNATNTRELIEAYGDDTDNWIGKVIQVWFDKNVTFGGKKVGGLRVAVPTNAVV